MRLTFRVIGLEERKHWKDGKPNVFKVKLRPVQSDENRRWLESIPDRPFELEVLTSEAARMFRVGADLQVEFLPVLASSAPVASAASPATDEKPVLTEPDIC